MTESVDLLQIKIDTAKSELPEDTLRAIAAVPWQATILKMRETKGFSFEQLEALQMETELLLAGILSPEQYPKELENRMKIPAPIANELVNEMNKEVFSKIKAELVKIIEKKNDAKTEPHPMSATPDEDKDYDIVFKSAGIEIKPEGKDLPAPANAVPPLEKPAPVLLHIMPKEEIHPIIAQKLSVPVQAASSPATPRLDLKNPIPPNTNKPRIDPYREIPE